MNIGLAKGDLVTQHFVAQGTFFVSFGHCEDLPLHFGVYIRVGLTLSYSVDTVR